MNQFIARLCITLTIALLPTSLFASVTLQLAYSDVESHPFQLGNGRKIPNEPGLALDIINLATEKMDVDLKYVRFPGKRVLHDIQKGTVDGGFIFSYNSDRAQYAHYPMLGEQPDRSRRIATIGYYFYQLKGNTQEITLEHLQESQQMVGAHLGYSIVNVLQDKNVNVHEVKTTEQLFRMLRSHRLTTVAIQETIAEKFLKEKNWTNVERVSPAIVTKDYYLIFSHQFMASHPQLPDQIWDALSHARKSSMHEDAPGIH